MEAKIYYQPIELNIEAHFGQKDLEIDFDKAVCILVQVNSDMLITLHNKMLTVDDEMIITNKEDFAEIVFKLLNSCPEKLLNAEKCKKVGHTSMSVGDYIEFEDAEILVCASVGWVEYECVYCGSKYCRFDCDESQAGGFD